MRSRRCGEARIAACRVGAMNPAQLPVFGIAVTSTLHRNEVD
ncbi:hypothetical protein HMPREF9622_00170 [Cutibacterium modestum HL037PA3]|nr:hypothetical protein HMPREF9622_00170 [Cutibacterium modestum HL037PA3]